MRHRFLFLLLIAVVSCDSDSNDDGKMVSSKIRIKLIQDTYAGGAPRIYLYAETTEQYPCLGYKIETSVVSHANGLSITYSEVEPVTGVCLASIGPATSRVNIEDYPNGTYVLELNNGNLKNNGWLKITDDEVVISLQTQNGVGITQSSLDLSAD